MYTQMLSPPVHFRLDTVRVDNNISFSESIQFPFYYVHRKSVIPHVSDGVASILINNLVYWVVSLTYHYLDVSGWKCLEKYRIHDSDEVKSRNLVTKAEVVRTVALQQCLLMAFGISWFAVLGEDGSHTNHALELRAMAARISVWMVWGMGERHGRAFVETYGSCLAYNMYWWIIPAIRFLFAFFILDTYQYYLHRLFHEVKFFYKHFHSRHHRLYVPYAFGALYGHPFEGAILDGVGATLSHYIAGMTDRQAILLFGFATYKTVDDHCGYYFPWHPVHMIFGNNSEYHDIHHQQAGIKSNFSQPLFIHWDVILGTRMTREQLLEKKRENMEQKSR